MNLPSQLAHSLRASLSRLASLFLGTQPFVPLLLLASVITVSYCLANFAVDLYVTGARMGFLDCVVASLQSDGNVPVAWLLASVVSMLLLSGLWQQERSHTHVLLHGSWRELWAGQLVDVVVVSACVSAVLFVVCLATSLAYSTDLSALGSPESAFAVRAGAALESTPSAATVLLVCLVHLFGVVLFCSTAFAAIRWLSGRTAPAFIALAVLGLSDVHGMSSFVYDLLRNLSGSVLTVNPLYLLCSFQGVDWQSWLPGASHNLWFLPLVAVCLAALVWLVAPRREAIPRGRAGVRRRS